MKAILIRKYEAEQTTGTLMVFENGEKMFECKTLELPWLDNRENISCIPEGKYIVISYYSYGFGQCFRLESVSGRFDILIHAGNYRKDTKGCILVGEAFTDLNKDGLIDITFSKATLAKMIETLPPKFDLIIE